MGPTASGKTSVAEALASRLDAKLVNADAFQVYRGFDIGTAKPRDKTRYELLDIKDPDEVYGVGEFVLRAQPLLNSLFVEGRSAVFVGGTGYYIRALFEEWQDLMGAPDPQVRSHFEDREREAGLEGLVQDLVRSAPDIADKTDLKNPVRVRRALERLESQKERIAVQLPAFRKLKVALDSERHSLNSRIEARTEAMLNDGWVEEVRFLLSQGVKESDPAMRAIGYRCLARFIAGMVNLEEASESIKAEVKQYAKRQVTWLRTEPRLEWVKLQGNPESAVRAIEGYISATLAM